MRCTPPPPRPAPSTRRLPPLQVLRLWEALWAGAPGLHLYLCVAVLEHHRRRILRWAGSGPLGRQAGRGGMQGSAPTCLLPVGPRFSDATLDFDGMLKLCVELSGRLKLEPLLRDAELLAAYAGAAGRELVAEALGAR